MDIQQIQLLEKKMADLKSIMLAYATDGRQDDQPQLYHELFLDLDILLEKAGYNNPNAFKTIESFWENCGGTWADRRSFISNIYSDTLFDLGRKRRVQKDPKNWEKANKTLQDELNPIRIQWLKAKNFIYSNPPDFENSIKEAINSIESILKILLNRPSDSLGKLIKNKSLDPDISKLISKAYGLTSNKDFVRHGGIENQHISKLEAEFFLEFSAVAIIYLREKLKGQ